MVLSLGGFTVEPCCLLWTHVTGPCRACRPCCAQCLIQLNATFGQIPLYLFFVFECVCECVCGGFYGLGLDFSALFAGSCSGSTSGCSMSTGMVASRPIHAWTCRCELKQDNHSLLREFCTSAHIWAHHLATLVCQRFRV